MTTPDIELCVSLTRAQARMALAVDDTLGAWHGLAWRELMVLHTLQRAPDATLPLSQAAARLGLAPSALLRMILPMEKTGWIERRGTQLVLRPAGDRLAREAVASADLAAQRELRRLPAPDRQRLREMLATLASVQTAASTGEIVR